MTGKKEIIVALAGNPNSGKTSLFNGLVGTHQKVGNFSGVTIEKYEGTLTYKNYKIKIIDLPGTYSLTAYSPEELIARNYIIEEKLDVVINVVDGTNLERNLYLTTQLMELETNLIVALNMFDEVKKQQIQIDIDQLETLLGSHVIPTNAVKKSGLNNLLDHVVRVYTGKITIAKNKLSFSADIEKRIDTLVQLIETDKFLSKKHHCRWLAVKLLENDQEVYSLVKERAVWMKIEKVLLKFIADHEKEYKEEIEIAITGDRNAFIRGALAETVVFPKEMQETLTDRIDAILINRMLGLPIFFAIMWGLFQFTFKLGEAPMGWLEKCFEFLAMIMIKIIPEGYLQSVIVDGIIAGVGGVLVFLPNIILLFLGLAFLEGTGYMARAAFVVDKVMHKVGLHGKSFIPMITGFGCSVPAFMSTRTLKNKADRLVTMMIIPFMSCGAKLPVYILLISAFFSPDHAGNVLFGIYLLGISIAIISAKILKTSLFQNKSEPFVMELPPYRMPTFRSLLMQMWLKAYMYLKKAGTIILTASVIIWCASNFPVNKNIDKKYAGQENLIRQEQLAYSVSGRAGKLIEPVIRPLGFDWRIGIGLVSGLAAKEVVVSTLGTIYSLGETDESSVDLAQKLQADPKFDIATALSLMVFVLLYMPCIAATTVFHKEAGEKKWTVIYISYSIAVAWIMAFITYRIASLFLL